MLDEYLIGQALKLAKKGIGSTNPNPMVGAIIVKDGQIVGKGYHRKAGLPHAEIEALNQSNSGLGASLYLNLEPCVHLGKTPPCVDAIIKSGITRVVCSTLDPNPKVDGKGVAKLRQAGISVSVGVGEKAARQLNEAHFCFHIKKRPLVAIKFAASLDGKMATKRQDAKWITNQKTREFARTLRGQYQAVCVGVNTIIHDDPHLGVRQKGKKDPLRIILDSALQIPLNAQVLRDNNVIIATTTAAAKQKQAKLKKLGVNILTFDNDQIPLKKLLTELTKQEIISILVEGGGSVLGSFLDEKLIDKVYAFFAPILVGGEKAVTVGGAGVDKIEQALSLKRISVKRFKDDFLVIGSL